MKQGCRMARYKLVLAAIACLGFVPSCTTVEGFSGDTPQLVAAPDSVSALLADAADRAANAMETLAAIEYARSPGVPVSPIGDAPVELRRAITVNWVGPVEPIVKSLADRASYNFVNVGNAPPVPIVVTVDAVNRPVIEILRDVGLQLGLRANLKVNAQERVIEIHYVPNAGIGG